MGGPRALRLLLDTHVWLWFLLEPDRLCPTLSDRLSDPSTEPWLSPISLWETALLMERGRIEVDGAPAAWIEAALGRVPVRDAALTREVAVASRTIAISHQDPADRFIAATAAIHELTLATADERLLAGSGYETLPNL